MAGIGIDSILVQEILERGNDVWIKRTKRGIVILEVNLAKRQELETRPDDMKV
jgi:hypothetical protein